MTTENQKLNIALAGNPNCGKTTLFNEGCGAVICAAGSGLAPADKKLYALRDILRHSSALLGS